MRDKRIILVVVKTVIYVRFMTLGVTNNVLQPLIFVACRIQSTL